MEKKLGWEYFIAFLSIAILFFSVGNAFFLVNLYRGYWIAHYWLRLFKILQIMEFILIGGYIFKYVKEKKKISKICLIFVAVVWGLALMCESTIYGWTFMYSDVKFVKSAAYQTEYNEYIYMMREDETEWSALQIVDMTEEKIELNEPYDMVSGIYWRSMFGQIYQIDETVKY